jgi:hypothetical protein
MQPSDDRHSTAANGQRLSGYRPETAPGQDEIMVTVPEAAEILGTTTNAVRSRMRRGKLRREDGEDGTVYVILDAQPSSDSQTTAEDSREAVSDGRETVEDSPMVEVLKDQVAHLRDQLDKEREANRENRRLLAAALERIPAIEAPQDPASESMSEPRESDLTTSEEQDNLKQAPGSRAAPLVAV